MRMDLTKMQMIKFQTRWKNRRAASSTPGTTK